MSWYSRSFVAAALLAATALPVLAESVWVQGDNVNILGGKGSIYPVLGNVKKGTELQVVSRDGKWVQVQSGNITGWVFESALSTQKVSGDLFSGMNSNAAGVNTAAAARGFDQSTDQYAASKGYNRAPLQHLIDLKKRIAPQEFEAFEKGVETNTATPVSPVGAMPQPAPGMQPMTPQTPAYTPQTPAYTPRAPQTPVYTPQQPTYTPQQPVYPPRQPQQPPR